MSGPIFVVELEPGLWMDYNCCLTTKLDEAKHFPSEIQAQHRLDYLQRLLRLDTARVVRIDEINPYDDDADARNQEGAYKFA